MASTTYVVIASSTPLAIVDPATTYLLGGILAVLTATFIYGITTRH